MQPEFAPAPEQARIPEVPKASEGLMLRIANGNFVENAMAKSTGKALIIVL